MSEKRSFEGDDSIDDFSIKRLCTSHDDTKLKNFKEWCMRGELILSPKVEVSRGVCAQYGLLAVDDIAEGECLFSVPRHMLLSTETSDMSQLLKDNASSLASESGWVPQLIVLMYEYTRPNSPWKPYLSLVPNFKELDLPMFWPRDELMRELDNTGVPPAVLKDLQNIETEFQNIVKPFVLKHPEVFNERCGSLDLYKQMVAFVMSYSFTEPADQDDDDDDQEYERPDNPPMMVPMADILNHVAKNNAQLKFGKEALSMVATKPIRKGEEVFNTYGQLANWDLLHMYGFAEPYPHNHYDVVDIPMHKVYEIFSQQSMGEELKLFRQKWTFLQNIDIISTEGSFVVGAEGILTEEEMYQTLKVLTMNKNQFKEHQEKEGWSEDDDKDSVQDESLTFDDIPKLPLDWKRILFRMVDSYLGVYGSSLGQEEAHLLPDVWATLSQRQKYSVYVRYGQLRLLHRLKEATGS